MRQERRIIAYKHYFAEFMESLTPSEQKKVVYVLNMLKSQQRINAKFVKLIRDGLYELRELKVAVTSTVYFSYSTTATS